MPFDYRDPETGDVYTWDQDYVPDPAEFEDFLAQKRREKEQAVEPFDAWSALKSGLTTGFRKLAMEPVKPLVDITKWYAENRDNPLIHAAGLAIPGVAPIEALSTLASGIGAGTSEAVSEAEQAGRDEEALALREAAMNAGTKEGIESSGKILTPLDIALMATGAGEAGLVGKGLGTALKTGTKVLSGVDLLAGGVQAVEAEKPWEKALGVARMAGAGLGLLPRGIHEPVQRPVEPFSETPSMDPSTVPPIPVQRGVQGVQEGVQANQPAGPGPVEPLVSRFREDTSVPIGESGRLDPMIKSQIEAIDALLLDKSLAPESRNYLLETRKNLEAELNAPLLRESPLQAPRSQIGSELVDETLLGNADELAREGKFANTYPEGDRIARATEQTLGEVNPIQNRTAPYNDIQAARSQRGSARYQGGEHPLLQENAVQIPGTPGKIYNSGFNTGKEVNRVFSTTLAPLYDAVRRVTTEINAMMPRHQMTAFTTFDLDPETFGWRNAFSQEAALNPMQAYHWAINKVQRSGRVGDLDFVRHEMSKSMYNTIVHETAHRVTDKLPSAHGPVNPLTQVPGLWDQQVVEMRRILSSMDPGTARKALADSLDDRALRSLQQYYPDWIKGNNNLTKPGIFEFIKTKAGDVYGNVRDFVTRPFQGESNLSPVAGVAESKARPGVPEGPGGGGQTGGGELPEGTRGGEGGAGEVKLGEVPPIETLEPTPAPPKSFNEFLNQKFGDKATTSRERAIAKAEWQRVKEERTILRLGKEAGIPPEKVKKLMEGMPKTEEEVSNLGHLRRFFLPVIDNLEKVHPWLKEVFTKYINDAELPAMRQIADSYRIKQSLDSNQAKQVIQVLDGKVNLSTVTDPTVKQAAEHYRSMLDQVWSDAVSAGVVKAEGKRQTYFPHKFAEGWEDTLLRMPQLDRHWNLRDPHLELGRIGKRQDYRRDLGVLDEYFIGAYRRISMATNLGKRTEILRQFMKKVPLDKATSDWLFTNIRRVIGLEPARTFDVIAGQARHVQALTDLGLSAFYQPAQAVNTSLYAGFGRSARALYRIVRNKPNEVYDAIRSGALAPDITQEVIQGAYGAAEGIKNPRLQKFMWGVGTIDKWTRVHANVAGKLLVEDALKGNKGAIKDLKTLGFTNLDEAGLADKVGKAVSDKALYRSGALEIPGWASSTAGKLATQYSRFMYRHSLFVTGMFKEAAQGNVRPLARFLAAAPTVIPAMGEILYPLREGLREAARQTVSPGPYDVGAIGTAARGNPDDEVQWEDVLRNKRIAWNSPLKRMLQNVTMWGGIGIFQVALERALRGGNVFEKGGRALAGPVASNLFEAVGAGTKLNEPKYIGRWGLQQVPIVGYPLSKTVFPPESRGKHKRRGR